MGEEAVARTLVAVARAGAEVRAQTRARQEPAASRAQGRSLAPLEQVAAPGWQARARRCSKVVAADRVAKGLLHPEPRHVC